MVGKMQLVTLMQLASGWFNSFCIVFSLLITSKTMFKKGSILCIWGQRCGNGEEREGKYLAFYVSIVI